MQMLGDAGAGDVAEVEPDVEAVRLRGLAEGADAPL